MFTFQYFEKCKKIYRYIHTCIYTRIQNNLCLGHSIGDQADIKGKKVIQKRDLHTLKLKLYLNFLSIS